MEDKVIYLSNSILPSYSANSVHVMKMCSAVHGKGFSVTLLAKSQKTNEVEALYDYYNVSNRFDIKLFPLFDFPGYSVFISAVIYVAYVLYISLIRRQNIIVYSRNRHASSVLAFFRIRQRYEMHGISRSKMQNRLDKFILLSRATEKIVVISKQLEIDVLDKYEVSKDKVIVAHDGADFVDVENVVEELLNGSFDFNVGYVGSLLEGKGVDLICEVASLLPSFGFHIVGGSGQNLLELKEMFNTRENLFFYGHLPQKNLPGILKSFDAVVLPNLTRVITGNREDIGKYTSPLKLFEYMALNKVIVLSDLPVFREVLSERDALFFKSGDLESFRDALIKSRDWKVGSDLPELIKSKYSWSKRVELCLG